MIKQSASRLAAIALLAASCVMSAQVESIRPMAKEAHPSFEVATIKRSDPENHSQGSHVHGQHLFFENQRIIDLLSLAYGVHPKQIMNAPAWFATERWDIQGVADVDGQPDLAQIGEMLRNLLEDRLALRYHQEKREIDLYAITIAKGGPKLTPTTSQSLLPDQSGSTSNGQTTVRYTSNSMTDIERSLRFFLERPVVNQTGLEGRYDFKLTWTTDSSTASGDNLPPSFFTAVQEQIGLKVKPTKGMVDVMMIDNATQPTPD